MAVTKEIATVGNMAVINVEYFSDSTIENFIASRHSAPATQKTYRNGIRRMLKYFNANAITAPTTNDMDAYICALQSEKKATASIRLYCTVAKLYFQFLEREGIYRNVTKAMAPLKFRKSSTHNRKSLTDEQAKKLLNAINGDDIISRRNKAIIGLSLSCGLRTCEISRADVADFSNENGFWTLAIQGKGRSSKDEYAKVPEPVAELINKYLELRGNVDDSEPLFTSMSNNRNWKENSYGSRLSEQTIGKFIKAAMKSVGIKGCVAHSCRHYCARRALKSGCNLNEIMTLLRHSSLAVSTVYLRDCALETRRAENCVADVLFGNVA